jgi:hypothetical protein
MKLDLRDITEIQTPVTAYQTFDQRKDRVQADRAIAEAAGFKTKDTVFAEGTAVIDIGVKNATASRKQYEALPILNEGLDKFESMIAAERRHELSVNVNELRVTDKFELGLRSIATVFPMLDSAYYQLASAADIPARTAAWLRAHALSDKAAELFQHSLGEVDKDKKVKVRGRTAAAGTGREVFAVVGPNYPVFDAAPTISGIVRKVLGHIPGARAEITYNRDRAGAFIDIVFHSDIKSANYAAGELFKAGVRIRTEDGGAGSARVSAFVLRNLCVNLYILDESVIELDRVVHAGSVDSRVERVTKALGAASQKIDTFAARWNKANVDEIRAPREMPGSVKKGETKSWADATVSERVAGLTQGYVHQKLLPPISGKVMDTIVKNYWQDQITGKDQITVAGLASAWTATGRDMDRWSGDALERAGGALLGYTSAVPVYQHVYTLG